MNQTPFSREFYTLATCSLSPMGEENARQAGEALASMDPWLTLGYSGEGLSRYLLRRDPALYPFILKAAGQDAGVLCMRFPWLLGPYIELFAVYKPFQGAGKGKELLEWVEKQCRPSSKNIWTVVSSFNTPGRIFYTKQGFIPVGPLHDLIKPGFSEILLRKKLEPLQ